MKTVFPLLLLVALASPSLLFAKKEMTTLNVLVEDEAGAPVPRASVVIRTLKGKKLKKVGETFQLRTSQQGTAPLPPIKQGFVMIQVIAKGFQTFGDTVQLQEAEQTVRVTLKPPQEQHSVHGK